MAELCQFESLHRDPRPAELVAGWLCAKGHLQTCRYCKPCWEQVTKDAGRWDFHCDPYGRSGEVCMEKPQVLEAATLKAS